MWLYNHAIAQLHPSCWLIARRNSSHFLHSLADLLPSPSLLPGAHPPVGPPALPAPPFIDWTGPSSHVSGVASGAWVACDRRRCPAPDPRARCLTKKREEEAGAHAEDGMSEWNWRDGVGHKGVYGWFLLMVSSHEMVWGLEKIGDWSK